MASRVPISETQLLEVVTDMLTVFRWTWHHPLPAKLGDSWMTAQAGNAGFPDLIAAKRGTTLAVELKSTGEYPGQAQRDWLKAMGHPMIKPQGEGGLVKLDYNYWRRAPIGAEPNRVWPMVWWPSGLDDIERLLRR